MESVLALAGVELTFFIAARMVLCSRFVTKKVLIAMFWLLLSSVYATTSPSLFPTLPVQQVGWGCTRAVKGHTWDS